MKSIPVPSVTSSNEVFPENVLGSIDVVLFVIDTLLIFLLFVKAAGRYVTPLGICISALIFVPLNELDSIFVHPLFIEKLSTSSNGQLCKHETPKFVILFSPTILESCVQPENMPFGKTEVDGFSTAYIRDVHELKALISDE